MSESETLSWQKAVAELTAERNRAEASVLIIKRLGDPGDITSAEIAYGGGRAEAEAVIAALIIALHQGKGADDIVDIDTRMSQAVGARETLARRATDLAAGKKSAGIDLLAKALPSLLLAVGALWRRCGESDVSTRATIAARLESARWLPFADIIP